MNERLKTTIRRRDVLLVVAASAVATGAGVASIASSGSPTPAANRRDKRKAQYQANSPEIQTFYRVNRYPVK
jgi:hypothetical protein